MGRPVPSVSETPGMRFQPAFLAAILALSAVAAVSRVSCMQRMSTFILLARSMTPLMRPVSVPTFIVAMRRPLTILSCMLGVPVNLGVGAVSKKGPSDPYRLNPPPRMSKMSKRTKPKPTGGPSLPYGLVAPNFGIDELDSFLGTGVKGRWLLTWTIPGVSPRNPPSVQIAVQILHHQVSSSLS